MAHLIRVLVAGTSLNEIQLIGVGLETSGKVSLAGITFLEEVESTFLRLRPELVLIIYDAQPPNALGIINRIAAQARVLLCGNIQGGETADALLAGARGVLPGSPAIPDILDMILADDGDGVICPDHVRYELFNRLCRLGAIRRSGQCIVSTDLSFQEVSVLRLLGAGLSNKQIAQQSNLSVHTVKNHVHWILKRLGVQSRIEAADYFQTLPRM